MRPTGSPCQSWSGDTGGHYGLLSLSIEPVPEAPLLLINTDTNQVELSWHGSAGSVYQIEGASNIVDADWRMVSGSSTLIGTGERFTNIVSVASGLEFFRLRYAGRCYGITDVMITDSTNASLFQTEPAEYTGLGVRRVTRPFVADEVGERWIGDTFIGDTATRIWVKYKEVSEAVASAEGLLTDIAVTGAELVCPDPIKHVLSGALPCPDGWQRANGPTTTNTQGVLGGSALCVRYRPASQVIASNELFVDRVSLGKVTDKGSAEYPHRTIGWQYDPTHIIGTVTGSKEFEMEGINITFSRRSPMPAGVFSNQEKLDLLTRYAPQIWLPIGEKFNPASADWAFPFLDRYLNSDGKWWLRTKAPLAFDITQGFGGSLNDNNPFYHGDLASAVVYAYWVEKDGPSTVDLVYYVYFPWNDGKTVVLRQYGHHISDWEHVTVRLKDGQPSAIYLSAHDFGQNLDWAEHPQDQRDTRHCVCGGWFPRHVAGSRHSQLPGHRCDSAL